MYNIEVDTDHSYYVGELGLLVHNTDNCGRPSKFREGVRDEVWGDARESSTGQVRDPQTGQFMSPDKPWDMGHKPGCEFKKHQESGREWEVSREQFLDEHNNPDHYRPEKPSSNRNHKSEDQTGEYKGP